VLPELTQRSVDYILSRRGQAEPFFLYVPFPSPHAPIIPSDAFAGKAQAGPYGDYMFQTDEACGRILAALEAIGASRNTLVVFSADNGSEFYAYERDARHDHWSSGPFRGVKRDIYEGGHRVPFIVRWPGVIEAGRVSDALLSQVDLMATFASLVGFELPRPAAEDSHDFLPYLRGEAQAGPRRTLVHNTYKDRYAVRDGDWVLIDAASGTDRPAPAAWNEKRRQPPDDAQPVELYDLKKDPGQRNNVAADHPGTVAAMRALLKRLRDQGHSAPRLD
jgi:arylsulfatase A